MKKYPLFALAISFLLASSNFTATAAEAKDDAVKKEQKKADGTWKIASMEVDGQKVPEEQTKTMTLVLASGKYTVKMGDKVIDEGTGKIDPTKKPKTIDATSTGGENKGQTLKGIYEIDGDTHKVCFAPAGKDRPTEFSSKPGSGIILLVYKRVKAK